MILAALVLIGTAAAQWPTWDGWTGAGIAALVWLVFIGAVRR